MPAERAVSAKVVDDIVLPFAVETLSTRGRLVRLGPAIDQLLKRHDYPEPVSKLVAEAVTLAALLGSTLKLEGRFQLQTKTRWSGLHAARRLRRAVESAGRLARFDPARLGRAAPATTCSGAATWPSPSIRAAT